MHTSTVEQVAPLLMLPECPLLQFISLSDTAEMKITCVNNKDPWVESSLTAPGVSVRKSNNPEGFRPWILSAKALCSLLCKNDDKLNALSPKSHFSSYSQKTLQTSKSHFLAKPNN